MAERKLACGCRASWADGSGVVAAGWVIEASAFLCPQRHKQGAFVADFDLAAGEAKAAHEQADGGEA